MKRKRWISLCMALTMAAATLQPLSAQAAGGQSIPVEKTTKTGEVTFSGTEFTGAQNRGIYAVNSENARANYYPYGDKESAMENFTLTPFEEDMVTANSPYLQSLNGTWKFYYAENPDKRPWPGNDVEPGFEQLTFADEGWDDIEVPGNWQVNWKEDGTFKYDQVIYTNSAYPWNAYGNGTVSEPNTPSVFNPVGTYRRTFTVPSEWKESGRSVFLNFDGADTFYVWINGKAVGYSADSMSRHEFDITPYINYDGENSIVVQVIRWSLGSWMEDQDFIRVSGIFRNIYLLAREEVDLYDFEVQTTPVEEGNYNGAWNLDVSALLRDFSEDGQAEGQESARLHAELYDGDAKIAEYAQAEAAEFTEITGGLRNPSFIGANVDFTMQVQEPKLWSAEHPNLYKLVLWVGDEVTCIRVGFREITYTTGDDARMFINGSRIMFYGTNLHETNPETGRTMTLDLIRQDMTLMKANNVNAVRMAHYPHDTRYYDLADELGLYVMDEANVESHGNRGITNQEAYGPAIRDRQSNMLERDKNYPSVVCWSVGNESGGGSSFRKYAPDWIRSRDTSRPIHCEFDGNGSGYGNYDMVSSMYSSPSSWSGTVSSAKKPAVLCEYVHAMGNSNGNWDEYIDIFDEQPKSVGGFIWDWVDQSILTPVAARYLYAYDAVHRDACHTSFTGSYEEGVDGYEGKALNGSVKFENLEDYGLTDHITVDAYVYSTSSGNGGNYTILGKGDHQFMIKETGKTIQWFVYTEEGEWGTLEVDKPEGYANAWHRLTGTYENQLLTLYIDGEKAGEQTVTGTITNQPNGVGVGACTERSGRDYQGYIAQARILSRAMSPDEIAALGTSFETDDAEVFRFEPFTGDKPEEIEDENRGVWYYAYGGDWGDVINDNNFCANGMVTADRTPKPQVDEMKYQYRMITADMEQNINAEIRDQKHPELGTSDQRGVAQNNVGDYEGTALNGWAIFPKAEDYGVNDNFTVEAYVYPSGGDREYSQIFSNGGDNGYQLRENGGYLQFIVHTENGWTQVSVRQPDNYAGRWHKLSATYADHTLKLYMDGELLGTKTAEGTITEQPYGISVGVLADIKSRTYDGYIAGTRLLKRALTEEEVKTSNPLADDQDAVFLFVPKLLDGEEQPLTYRVTNKFLFTNTDAYQMSWQLTEDGKVIQEGTDCISVDPAPAGVSQSTATSKVFEVPFEIPETLKPGAEYYFNVRFSLKEDAAWASTGHVISISQMKLFEKEQKDKEIAQVSEEKLEVQESDERVTVSGKDFSISFDKENQVLDAYQFKGRDLLVSGPKPNFYRALNDNDQRNGNASSLTSWRGVGSTFTDGSVTVEKTDNLAVIRASGNFGSKEGTYTTTYTVYPNGEVKVDESYDFSGLTSNTLVSEIGTIMTVLPDFENITWFGRGDGESYVDRKTGNPVGIWNTTVTDNYFAYIKPQDTGNKVETRWLALTDDDGFGFIIKAGEFDSNAFTRGNVSDMIEFNALHYSQEELTSTKDSQHHPYQLEASENTYLKINMASRGLGGDNSWGATPHSQYVIDAKGKTYHYNYSILPTEKFNVEDATAYSNEKHDFYRSLQKLIAEVEAAGYDTLTQEAKLIKEEDGDLKILNAYNKLREGYRTAEEDPDQVVRDELGRLIALIEALDADAYTPESWAKAEAALAAAKAAQADQEASRKELDAAMSSLIAAFGDLEYGVQKLHLEVAIGAAQEILELSADYEDTTALETAVEEGKNVLETAGASQETVNAAADMILEELFKLAKRADLQSLESLLAAARQLQEDKYTSASFERLTEAIEYAAAVAADSNREPKDISDAYGQLVKAIQGLEMKGNKAALKSVIEKAEDMLSNAEDYVASTIEGLEKALAQAKEVSNDQNATQSQVSDAVKALTAEMTQARLIGDVNGDGEITTKDTAAVLQAAAERKILSVKEAESADATKDGKINTNDAVLILQYAAEKLAKF